MNTTAKNNTTFQERLQARLLQMAGETDVVVRLSPEQKARNAAAARVRYANRTDAQKEHDKVEDRARYHKKNIYSKRNKEAEARDINERIAAMIKE